ncbi:MAG: hypothetical protein LRY38_08360 [Aeromonadaceae bacterium]|nr:hypothetical protein [Aeromonadaceae bacterium]
MPNQDLLFSILPRAPIKPGSGEFNKDVAHISPEAKLRRVESHKDPQERGPQDEYHPEPHPHDAEATAVPDDAEPDTDVKTGKDGQEHVDLYI